MSTKAFESNARCTQGPIDARFVATGHKWGESIAIRACGPHGINAQAQVSVDGQWRNGGSVGTAEFDNARCVLRDAEVVARSSAQGSGGGTTSPSNGGGSTAGSTAAAAPGISGAFRETSRRLDQCWEQTMVFSLDPLDPGAEIHVRLWADEPQDLEGALIQITHNNQVPNVSDKEWQAHLDKEEREWNARLEKKDRERASRPPPTEAELRARLAAAEVYTGPTGAPPTARLEPTRPRPSVNADWVAGYWNWIDKDWFWIAGQWRVPAADIHGGLTVRAPMAPPSLRNETISIAPGGGAVWTPGYWAWDGKIYVWVAGAWRLPPQLDSVWQEAGWRIELGGAVFLPGGWSLR